MLKLVGWFLVVLGLLMHFLPKLVSARASMSREKLDRETGNDPIE